MTRRKPGKAIVTRESRANTKSSAGETIFIQEIYLENSFGSRLNDFANEREHTKIVIWRVLGTCGFIFDRAKGPAAAGSTAQALHRADQLEPQADPLYFAGLLRE
jgi:hypothetical protein